MHNFNTNQARHFYVAGAVNDKLENNLDIAFGSLNSGEVYFKYRNADGLITRTDTISPKKVSSLKHTKAADMAVPLLMHTVKVNTDAADLTYYVGKTVNLIITLHGVVGYDDSDTETYVASFQGTVANTASAAEFHKAAAMAAANALPRRYDSYPPYRVFVNGKEVKRGMKADEVYAYAPGFQIVEGLQKYVRGKLSGEPCHISLAFRVAGGSYLDGDIAWATDTVAKSNIDGCKVLPANYVLADLEWFAYGERGDYYRGYNYPNDYTPTYAIDPFSSTEYDVLTIQYWWDGGAENVQKSPRMIQIAGPAEVITSLEESVKAKMDA